MMSISWFVALMNFFRMKSTMHQYSVWFGKNYRLFIFSFINLIKHWKIVKIAKNTELFHQLTKASQMPDKKHLGYQMRYNFDVQYERQLLYVRWEMTLIYQMRYNSYIPDERWLWYTWWDITLICQMRDDSDIPDEI